MPVALDIETRPKNGCPSEYALQPWRYQEGRAEISNIAVARHTGSCVLALKNYRTMLRSLAGQQVVTWNGVFDVAWLIAYGYWDEVKAIQWVDGMLLWKWLSNSQYKERIPRWSLADGAQEFCADEPWLEKFLEMKSQGIQAGTNDKYWEMRAKFDAIVTAKIGDVAFKALDVRRTKSAMIANSIIPEVARSWVLGVPMDFSKIVAIKPVVAEEMLQIEFRLGVSNFSGAAAHSILGDSAKWTPSKILRSPKQLGHLLFKTWKLKPKRFTDKSTPDDPKPSTDKIALTYLADESDLVIEILRWRELNTQLTKYLESPLRARAYLGSDVMHPSPKIFSTYTGRFTYASKTLKKYATGMAIHQWPRNKAFRALLVPPAGFKHVEYDAAGQESRIMAHQSKDETMIRVFQNNMKIHAMTGAKISGMSYDDFMKGRAAGNETINGEHGLYYQGKLINLSSNFRVGVTKMRIQARVQYGMNVDFQTVEMWQSAFHSRYPGVKEYHKAAIARAKHMGYAETLAGRRFDLTHWSKDDRWSTESSALMFPIQGTGADMSDLAIRELAKRYPEFIFWFALHDGLHMLVKEDVPNDYLLEARDMLDAIDYKKEWGVDMLVPLTWDCSVGPRWSDLKEL